VFVEEADTVELAEIVETAIDEKEKDNDE